MQYHHRDAAKRGGLKSQDSSVMLQPGQVVFRFLCHVDTVGGVIGNSGMIVKNLERDTGAKIRVQDTVPNCQERVINVIGCAAIDKKINVDGEECELSQAQEALIRVFERVLEVEGSGGGVIGCRVLAAVGQVGAVMGRGGMIVDKIRKSSGAKIRVLPKDQLADCAAPDDELIQLMGGIVAVKKALVAVSRRLQDNRPTPTERKPVNVFSHPDPHAEFLPNHCPLSPPLPENSVDCASEGHSLSADMDRILNLDEGSGRQKVVFRLLISTDTVGGVIGKGGTIVKALENEIGASIRIAPSVAWSKERIATISALENPEPLYSPAQTAIIRLFTRSIEVGFEKGSVSDLSQGETVTARFLVSSKQVGCLIEDGGVVASNICTVSGVEIQLLAGDLVPKCAAENDRLLQITGVYENVKSALFQVTGKLRDDLFSNIVADVAGARQYAYPTVLTISPYDREKTTSLGFNHLSGLSPFDQEMMLTREMDHLGFLHKIRGRHFPWLQTMGGENMTSLTDSERGLTFGDGLELESVEPAVVKNSTVEVVVPKQVFSCVYGENGSNLARLKQISGATIIVQDPCPEKCEGKVIVSGMFDQIQVARSLLQAFILPEQ